MKPHQARYDRTAKGRERHRRYEQTDKARARHARARARHRDKKRARDAVATALRSGRLVRPASCERCGARCKPQAHHASYDRPLDVEFLCGTCHGPEHREGAAP